MRRVGKDVDLNNLFKLSILKNRHQFSLILINFGIDVFFGKGSPVQKIHQR